jgi:hypothetical protein
MESVDNVSDAVCESYLAILGRPKDLLRVRATQITRTKYRVTLWRRFFGITDSAFVVVDENANIVGVQKDLRKGRESAITKRY